jgi:D-threo-aldose 1-dehydrogenase
VARARGLAEICAEFDVALPTAAVQFPLRHPAVVAELIAMASADQLRQTVARFAVSVPEGLWDRLDEGAIA